MRSLGYMELQRRKSLKDALVESMSAMANQGQAFRLPRWMDVAFSGFISLTLIGSVGCLGFAVLRAYGKL